MYVDDVVAGTRIFFMITNFYVDISEPMTTKSWVVTVFTEDDFFIDWIGSGLT
jgi:hypothetical protein